MAKNDAFPIVGELLSLFRLWKYDEFTNSRSESVIWNNVKVNLTVDKTAETINQLNSMGITDIWADVEYLIGKKSFFFAHLTISDASLDQVDQIFQEIINSGERIAVTCNNIYSNEPRACSDCEVSGVVAEGINGDPQHKLQTDKIEERLPFRICDRLTIKHSIHYSTVKLPPSGSICQDWIEDARIRLDSLSYLRLWCEDYPKVSEVKTDTTNDSCTYDSADTVDVESATMK